MEVSSSGTACSIFDQNLMLFNHHFPPIPPFPPNNPQCVFSSFIYASFDFHSRQIAPNNCTNLLRPQQSTSNLPDEAIPSMAHSPSDPSFDIYISRQSTFGIESAPDPTHPLKGLSRHVFTSTLFADFSHFILTDARQFKGLNRFSKLSMLCLSGCHLQSIPASLFTLPKSLRFIDFSNNAISSLPTSLKWDGIEGINLSQNALYRWPEILCPRMIPSLRSLSVSYNPIAVPPHWKVPFQLLESADLSSCMFDSFPQALLSSPRIKAINLSWNVRIIDFTLSFFKRSRRLRWLDISGLHAIGDQRMCSLPPSLAILVAHRWAKENLPAASNTVVIV